MAISVMLRPDRVTATGVVAPYPVREENPVKVAQNTVNPFIYGIRSGGPALSGPNQVASIVSPGHQKKMMYPSRVADGFWDQIKAKHLWSKRWL